ncbi:SAM-dependent methyltransferase [Nonomuraea indica]|uniref:SAM-dependent methyltransferase n=1 Tax=Nonomuraea indica TaxID=1581193 RepID=UPI000C7CB116|nr:SAM-dependent methyltransferase [Nonomuraea indica]
MVEFDPRTPNLARMYDYMLGGVTNYAVDREATDRLAELVPQAVPLARVNRGFQQRAVRHLAASGVRQFLDLGSGLPTQGSVHQVVPDARVVYVDRDPVVAEHATALLRDESRAAFVQADLLDAAGVLERAAAFLDLGRPVGVLLISILHFIPDTDGDTGGHARDGTGGHASGDTGGHPRDGTGGHARGDTGGLTSGGVRGPHAAVAALREAVAPGSHLVLTHSTSPGRAKPAAGRGTARPPARIRSFFGDFTLVEPGLVHAADWRPDRPRLVGEPSTASYLMAGVGWKTRPRQV